METPDKNKADSSLGDLKDEVAAGFTRIETDIRELRGEMVGLRGETTEQLLSLRSEMKGEISGLKREMKAGFEKVEAKFDRLTFRLLVFAGAMCLTLAGSIVAAVLS